MSNLDGLSVKKDVQVDVMEVNTTQESNVDKYSMAFAIFHEMRVHMDNNSGTGDTQHEKFGNFQVSKDLSLSGTDVKPGSDAWNFLRQLLTLKIKDGNGTDQNKADLKCMVTEDEKQKQK